MKKNIAIISPNENAYSETFIQNHKKFINANIKFYYNGHLPSMLEGKGLLTATFNDKVKYGLKKFILKENKNNYLSEKALVKSMTENKIDLVFAEYGPTGVAMLDICKKMNIPLIVNFHGYDASVIDVLKEHSENYLKMFDYSKYIIAVSSYMENTLLKLGCPRKKLVNITYGPEDEFLKIEPVYSDNSFLSVGRFVDKKAPYYTIIAFKKVVQEFPDAILYMAGNGPLYNSSINLTKHLRLENNIRFLGVLTHNELLKYYSKVKGYVQHSIRALNGDMEGTPVAILEASAAGLPVISTKHAGIPDVIKHGKTGFLVEEHDVEKMAEYMILLLRDKELVKTLGKSGKELISSEFSMEQHIEKINGLI